MTAEVLVQTPVVAQDEDAEAKALMAQWDAENGDVSDVEADVDDEVDDDDKYRREVSVTDNTLDHVVLGTSDLETALNDFEAMTGVRPVAVTSMNGLGTKSARVSFDGCTYLEIIGPDPKQTPTELADKLADIEAGKMVPIHYGIRSSESEERKSSVWTDELGLQVDKITMVAADQGMPWTWDLYILEGHENAGLVPNFLHWPGMHPCGKLPIVGSLDSVTVRVPFGNMVHKLVAGMDGIEAMTDETTGLEFTFTSEKGTHSFSSSEPIGIVFPKEGGLTVEKTGFE